MVRICVLGAVLFLTGCASLIVDDLRIRSAGFTGCASQDNEISNVNPGFGGGGTWNVTCKGKVYLCSQGSSGGHPASYSCAVAVN
jgi:hypothetical protein